MTSRKNIIGLILQVIGIVIIVVNLFRALSSTELVGGGLAFDIFLQGVIYGTLFLGFGELINLMQGLFNQREPENIRPKVIPKETYRNIGPLEASAEKGVSSENRERITALFAKRNLAVDSIETSSYEGYVIVHHQGKRSIVDLNGFHPQILTDKEVNEHPQLKTLAIQNEKQ